MAALRMLVNNSSRSSWYHGVRRPAVAPRSSVCASRLVTRCRGDQQSVPGGELVQQAAARDTGLRLDGQGGSTRISVLDQAVDGRVEDERPALGGALPPRAPAIHIQSRQAP